jgi:hypothetical protein
VTGYPKWCALCGLLIATAVTRSPAQGEAGSAAIVAAPLGGAIQADSLPPTGLTYGPNPAACTVGVAITLTPHLATGADGVMYSLSPSPPQGLGFSPFTGVIAGTTVDTFSARTYRVCATNNMGNMCIDLVLSSVTSGATATGAASRLPQRARPVTGSAPRAIGEAFWLDGRAASGCLSRPWRVSLGSGPGAGPATHGFTGQRGLTIGAAARSRDQ